VLRDNTWAEGFRELERLLGAAVDPPHDESDVTDGLRLIESDVTDAVRLMAEGGASAPDEATVGA
jgi:hypothetical protein